jgi:phosphatidylserine decarboxylase
MGLDECYEAPDGLFKPVVIELIRDKLKKAFTATFYFTVEVGLNGRLHAHVVACADACALELPQDGETVKLVAKGTEYKVLRYLHKEAPQLPELIREHAKAVKRHGGKLPFVRGFVRLERLQTARKRSMWIGHDWRRTRKAMLERAASKVRLRTMGNKAKPNYHGLYRDSPTEWDIASFADFSRLPTKRKTKRRVANVTALRA